MKKKPHILHLLATEFVGGPEKQVLTHLRYVDRDRFQLTVGSYLEGGRANAFLREAAGLGAPTLALYQHIPMDPRLIRDLRRALRDRNIDALITHGYKSNVVGHLAAKGRVPQAMYVRGWTAESRRVRLYHGLERRVLPRGRLVVTVAEQKRGEIRAMGIPEAKIRVIVNAVEDLPLEPAAVSLRQQYDLPEDQPLLVAAGRLSPEKGHKVLVEAAARCREHGTPVSCVIYGEGPEEERLRRQIARSDLEGRVILAGFDPGWKRRLMEADALVNPSLSEVMPNVVLEAMVHGCPVIATRVGGVPELLPHAALGWTPPPGDAQALAAAVEDLVSGNHDLKAMAARARERVTREFTFGAQAAKLHDLYNELVYGTEQR